MFRHHGHDKPLTEAERDKLLGDGAAIQGMVMHNEPTEADRRVSRIRVTVTFKDGQLAEFSEELASLYQPAPGSPEAQRLAEVRGAQQLRHADRVPKIQLPLSAGERVPVRYDADGAAAHPDRAALDGTGALPRVRRPGRPGPGLPGPRPAVPVLPPAGPRAAVSSA